MADPQERTGRRRRIDIYRHPVAVRVTHWVNAICVGVLLASGLQIFNAHPALYLGQSSNFSRPVLAITSDLPAGRAARGHLRLLGVAVQTTGVLGVSPGADGSPTARAFPHWMTLPGFQDLALGRRWHFFFAWLFAANLTVLISYGVLTRRFRRTLAPTRSDLSRIGASIWDHLRLRFPHGPEAWRYNVLQKLTYSAVLGGLLPLMLVSGLAMSPAIDAAAPWLPMLLGGRQTARTIHFLSAMSIGLFVAVHLAMVALSGPLNNLRAIITGRYALYVSDEDDHGWS
ncbi:cytochrome b/b6 domain-containing protein [Phenylobacterium montanum]|uniref:Cytochrome b/b6 domain-containing protein n=1 Tax=Phenylobacterium montanum TaxID=2823693 RepID=A0A975IW88_9CAUL|nr:cytochrome b/b6 domain-containing protein [Caulobacter sp. S6]QUD89822.1 cytochrome b/b6 domain-containing protein [Caulobacter sp. S6]